MTTHACPTCDGAGIVDTSPPGVEHTAPWLQTDTDCPRCDGSGEIEGVTGTELGCTCGGMAACQQCQERDAATFQTDTDTKEH